MLPWVYFNGIIIDADVRGIEQGLHSKRVSFVLTNCFRNYVLQNPQMVSFGRTSKLGSTPSTLKEVFLFPSVRL